MVDGVRNFSPETDAAIRLYMQHWIAKSEMGFLLHPSIPTPQSTKLKILDVACGTGLWLASLASILPNAELHGFDLSPAHFPPQEELPQNVKIWQQDATQSVSATLHGQYDVIHIARLHLHIPDAKLASLIKNFKALLKPSGFLQWDELDVFSMHVARAQDPRMFPAFARMHDRGNAWLKAQSGSKGLVDEIPELLKPYGFRIIDHKRWEISKAMSKPWTDMQLIANRDYLENMIATLTERGGENTSRLIELSRANNREVEKEVKEQGLRILMDMLYTVAQSEE